MSTMIETVELDELAPKLNELIKTYTKEIVQECSDELSNQADLLVKDISASAPVSNKTGIHLKDTFIKSLYSSKKQKGMIINREFRIHSDSKYNKYRIVHLLENGFYNKRIKRRIEGTKFLQNALIRRRRILSLSIKKIIEK